MNAIHCSLATPDIEVVTVRTGANELVTEIHGGQLDGERFVSDGHDMLSQHERACRLARIMAWGKRR